MKEILFRGKRKDNGQWVEGYYFKTELGCFIGPYNEEHQVISETVGQYTGLNDRNENKIWEGDVLKVNDYKIMEVVFKNGCYYTPYNSSDYRLGGWKSEIIEIVGNIHDNPELITQ